MTEQQAAGEVAAKTLRRVQSRWMPTEENNGTEKSGTENSKRDAHRLKDTNVCLAALRATLPLPPILAIVVTVLAYVLLGETGISAKIKEIGGYAGTFGAVTVTLGFVATVFVWLVVAHFIRPYTAAHSANHLNYNLLCEHLDLLKSQIRHSCHDSPESLEQPTNTVDRIIRNKACGIASQQCKKIDEGLKGKGMPWVTGRGYIELWHRVHRAEEALIKVEPHAEALAGAMRDESRLLHSNIHNKDMLLKRLRCAVAILDDSATGEYLNYLAKPVKCPLSKEERAMPENRLKALTILSVTRYEINNFRDNVWEGIINARNRLAGTSAVLGFTTYSLLVLALFMNVPYYTIVWVAVYFLVGALAGLFTRSQAEWTTDTAVDDFGLSTTRLLHVHWLSGLAAVGGVLITSLADTLVANSERSSELTAIFGSTPFLLMVAAVFGLTPDLLIRRLAQQADQYKEDLRSTQSSQSTKASQPGMQGGQA
jgi:hypothetical protein